MASTTMPGGATLAVLRNWSSTWFSAAAAPAVSAERAARRAGDASRTKGHIARARDDHFLVVLQGGGTMVSQQDGRVSILREGDCRVKLRPLPTQQFEQPSSGELPEWGELLVASDMTIGEFDDSNGWCSLGDVMRRDRDGYLYYVKRLDRMINTGYHVYPDEIEAAIAQMTGISRVLVRGEPHEKWGEMVVAYIVADAGPASQRMIGELRSSLAQRLARYKIPREFRVVAELPPA